MANIYKRGNAWYIDYRLKGTRYRKSVGRKKDALAALKQVTENLQVIRTQKVLGELHWR